MKNYQTIPERGHVHLSGAKIKKNDEFYTMYPHIVMELSYYKDLLKNSVVYCNCDDRFSKIRLYLMRHFRWLGLKRLYCTGINGYYMEYDGTTLTENRIRNGDFRSPECMEILSASDICITNPPFSLLREYVRLVPNFLIIVPKTAIAYKDVFPKFADGTYKLGFTRPTEFNTPDGAVKKMSGMCRWLTTLPVEKEYAPFIGKPYDASNYDYFDNYPAINVNNVEDIPDSFYGLMGTPITFMDYLNPDEFEIVDMIGRYAVLDHSYDVEGRQLTEIDGEPTFSRLIVRRKNNHNNSININN